MQTFGGPPTDRELIFLVCYIVFLVVAMAAGVAWVVLS